MKSEKWKIVDAKFEEKSSEAKINYYDNMVKDLRTSEPGQWYSKVKRMSSLDPTVSDTISVEELEGLSSLEQAETIADQFGKISNIYEPVNQKDIDMSIFQNLKTTDVPWKIIVEFSVELSFPLSNIYSTGVESGEWPDIWKFEFVTPCRECFLQPKLKSLKISGNKNFSNFFEAILSDPIIEDISPSIDVSQYGNQKGLSIQHYLVQMVNKILTILDTNNEKEKYAVLAQLIDWKKAFDMQDPKLGIESFIR